MKFRILASIALAIFTLQANATIEIQWWHAMGGSNTARINKIAKDFNDSQKTYVVKPVYKGGYAETMTSAIAAFRAHKQPDIVQVFEVGTASMMAAKGAIYPVEDLMKDNHIHFNKNDYLPAVISYYQTTRGKLLSLPFNSSTPVLWYNEDAFKKAGIKNPPKTWKEVGTDAKKLVESGMKCGLAAGWQSWTLLENYSAWNNLPLGTEENGFAGLNTKLVFNKTAVVKNLDQLHAWMKDGRFAYGGRQGKSLPMFINQECGMWINSSAYYGSMSKAKFKVAQTMLPYDDTVVKHPQNSIIGGATLWVLKGKPKSHYKGVAEFLSYLSKPSVQAWWHQTTGYVPITKAAYALSQKQGYYKTHPGTDTAIKELSLNTPTPNSRGLRFGNFVQIRDIINAQMEAIWKGDKTAQQAMDTAVSQGNKLLRKFEAANK
jgi:sn-glycerol 3-phosphate transport system substrate-binding protein